MEVLPIDPRDLVLGFEDDPEKYRDTDGAVLARVTNASICNVQKVQKQECTPAPLVTIPGVSGSPYYDYPNQNLPVAVHTGQISLERLRIYREKNQKRIIEIYNKLAEIEAQIKNIQNITEVKVREEMIGKLLKQRGKLEKELEKQQKLQENISRLLEMAQKSSIVLLTPVTEGHIKQAVIALRAAGQTNSQLFKKTP